LSVDCFKANVKEMRNLRN